MEIKRIDFEKMNYGDEEESYPSKLFVEITLDEAIWMARVAGKQAGYSPHCGIYDALTGDVFNRYWDDGVDEAMIGRNIKIPPIVYSKESEGENE